MSCIIIIIIGIIIICSITGYIQTRGWQQDRLYSSNMDSCVTLVVPNNRVTMISVVSLDLHRYSNRRCDDDFLEIYSTANCTGLSEGTGEKLCETRDLPLTVYRKRNLSFRFVSDGFYHKTGFRLLYSFLRTSEEPQKLQNSDKWNCSVSSYHTFEQHFLCSSQDYCSDKRDKVLLLCRSVCLSVCLFPSLFLPFSYELT